MNSLVQPPLFVRLRGNQSSLSEVWNSLDTILPKRKLKLCLRMYAGNRHAAQSPRAKHIANISPTPLIKQKLTTRLRPMVASTHLGSKSSAPLCQIFALLSLLPSCPPEHLSYSFCQALLLHICHTDSMYPSASITGRA